MKQITQFSIQITQNGEMRTNLRFALLNLTITYFVSSRKKSFSSFTGSTSCQDIPSRPAIHSFSVKLQ